MAPHVMTLFSIAVWTLAVPLLLFMASFMSWPSFLITCFLSTFWGCTFQCNFVHIYLIYFISLQPIQGRPGFRPSKLLLHDLCAQRCMILHLTSAQYLPKHLHLPCVDMPGHEGTTRTNVEDHSVQDQVRRIRQFVETVQLNRKPFHMVGTSMGGNVAGVYVACYPSDLCSLTSSVPLVSLIRSACPSPEEMQRTLQLLSKNVQIFQGLLDLRIAHNGFYHEVFMEIIGQKSKYALHKHLKQTKPNPYKQTTHPDFIYMQVVDVSGASMLAEAVPGCCVDLLEKHGAQPNSS
uniref:AB hydrolase-1 domain-containing protein n=1 Tax=Electrophorus electricus TaxID=8005 RepID=A0A4W4EKL3_ELEEL